jgi:hypothetical protein
MLRLEVRPLGSKEADRERFFRCSLTYPADHHRTPACERALNRVRRRPAGADCKRVWTTETGKLSILHSILSLLSLLLSSRPCYYCRCTYRVATRGLLLSPAVATWPVRLQANPDSTRMDEDLDDGKTTPCCEWGRHLRGRPLDSCSRKLVMLAASNMPRMPCRFDEVRTREV